MDDLQLDNTSTEAIAHDAIASAMTQYVKGLTALPNFKVRVERVEGAFARVAVTDPSGEASPAIGFAQRGKDGQWKALGLGTFFEPAFYQAHGIPTTLAPLG